jgi:uncharacterized protein (TIGR03545 family)
LFPGIPSTADVLVRTLRISGKGSASGQPFTFEGAIHDLTHQPRRHDVPATIQFHTDGAIRLIAQGTLDRRQPQAVDRWTVEIPAWQQNGELLGDARKLAVKLAPGTARIHADFTIHDRTLSGTVTVDQDHLTLEPSLDSRYAKIVSPASVQAAVSGVQQLHAELHVSGELRKPHCRLSSNLGPELASGLRQAVQQELAARQQQLLDRAHQQVAGQLDRLQQDLVAQHGDILRRLEIGDEQLDQLKSQLTARLGSPAELISRGKKLLFK